MNELHSFCMHFAIHFCKFSLRCVHTKNLKIRKNQFHSPFFVSKFKLFCSSAKSKDVLAQLSGYLQDGDSVLDSPIQNTLPLSGRKVCVCVTNTRTHTHFISRCAHTHFFSAQFLKFLGMHTQLLVSLWIEKVYVRERERCTHTHTNTHTLYTHMRVFVMG